MKKTKRNSNVVRNVALGVLAVGSIATATMLLNGQNSQDITIDATKDTYEKAPVTFHLYDAETEAELSGMKVYVEDKFGVHIGTFDTDVAIADTFFHQGTYKAIVLDSALYGNDVEITTAIDGLKLSGEDFEFSILSKNGMSVKLNLNAIGEADMKFYDNDAGTEAFVSGSDEYTNADMVVVNGDDMGGVIDTTSEVLDQKVIVKATSRDAVFNQDGQLIVIDSSLDEWDTFSVNADGVALKKLTEDELEEGYSKATYDAFVGKQVFVFDDSNAMARNVENEFSFFTELKSGATISKDISASIYSIANIETSQGVEADALLRTPKTITWNIFA